MHYHVSSAELYDLGRWLSAGRLKVDNPQSRHEAIPG